MHQVKHIIVGLEDRWKQEQKKTVRTNANPKPNYSWTTFQNEHHALYNGIHAVDSDAGQLNTRGHVHETKSHMIVFAPLSVFPMW
jgi:hypothetical protein